MNLVFEVAFLPIYARKQAKEWWRCKW